MSPGVQGQLHNIVCPFSKKKKKMSHETRFFVAYSIVIIVITVLFRLKSITIFAGMSIETNGYVCDPSITYSIIFFPNSPLYIKRNFLFPTPRKNFLFSP
jgi:hypothetical protein